MQKLLQVSDFAKSGLNTDIIAWDLPGSYLTRVNNIRIHNNKLSPSGGYELWSILPVDFDAGFLTHVGSTSGEYWLIAGQDKVYAFNGISYSDITVAGGYPASLSADDWVGCNITNIPILNNGGDYPQYWPIQSPGVQLEYLPWDATSTWKDNQQFCKIMRSHKQYLFALVLQNVDEEIPDGVRWSSPADIGGVPETWDPLDITNVAGITNLGGDGGRIIDGLSLRDAFIVYREKGISVFDYIGGQFVWRIRNLDTTAGLLSPNCIVSVKGLHYFISNGDIVVNDGNTLTSILKNRVQRQFASDINPDTYTNSYAVKNSAFKEIWFCIPTSTSVYPNKAYVYNWSDDTVSIRDIPESPFVSFGSQTSEPLTWDITTGVWDSSLLSWNRRETTPYDDTVVAVTKPTGAGTSGELLLLDYQVNSSPTQFNTIIERVGFALEGLNSVTSISRIYPHMTGPGTVQIEVGSQDYPGSPVRWRAPVDFTGETDRKIDVRTTGELHCFRISSQDESSHWAISGIDIEYTWSGQR